MHVSGGTPENTHGRMVASANLHQLTFGTGLSWELKELGLVVLSDDTGKEVYFGTYQRAVGFLEGVRAFAGLEPVQLKEAQDVRF